MSGNKVPTSEGVSDPVAVAKYIADLEQELRKLQELQESLRRNPEDGKAKQVRFLPSNNGCIQRLFFSYLLTLYHRS